MDQTQYVDCANKKTKSIVHLASGFSIATPIEYKEMHNKIGIYIHWKICKYNGILDCEKWYRHQPELIAEAKGVTII